MSIDRVASSDDFFAITRGAVITVAIVAIVLGAITLFWPEKTVALIAFLFGIFLVISGIQRIVRAVGERKASGGWFVFHVIVGVLITIAGILSLANPQGSILFLAIVIGIGWILGGAADIVRGTRAAKTNWLAIVGGAFSLLAGLAFLFAPAFAVPVFVTFGAILLILVGLGASMTYPRIAPPRATAA